MRLGASFSSPLWAVGGGEIRDSDSFVMVPRRSFLADLVLLREGLETGVVSRALVLGLFTLGEDASRFEGSTGGKFRLGEKWLAWVAISRAKPSAESSRLWELAGVAGTKSGNCACEPLRLPGVALKTEYSSAKRGVEPPKSVKEPCGCRGVSKTGLANEAEVGVCWGVGG